MLSKLVEHDRRQQMRAEEAARRGMERRGSLADRLAIPARELLPHRLDHLEASRDLLQRFRHVLAQLRQPRAAAAPADRRRLNNDAFALNVIRIGLAHRPLAREGAHGLVFSPPQPRPPVHPRSPPSPVLRAAVPAGRSAAGCAHGVGHASRARVCRSAIADTRSALRCWTASPSHWPASARHRRIPLGLAAQPCLALSQQRGLGAGKVRRKGERRRWHGTIESDFPAISIAKTGSNPRRTPGFLRVRASRSRTEIRQAAPARSSPRRPPLTAR